MNDRELFQQSLMLIDCMDHSDAGDTVEALRARLAQPKQQIYTKDLLHQ